MTRASLLHILDNLGDISETEVQELEQLAATFPYCQTAHLLLAKAAHDRGSMLAAQRLRRAATYAVDRQRLRALIELPALLPAIAEATQVAVAPAPLEIAPRPALASTAISAPEESQATSNTSGSELELPNPHHLGSIDLAVTTDLQEPPILAEDEVAEEGITVATPFPEEAFATTSFSNVSEVNEPQSIELTEQETDVEATASDKQDSLLAAETTGEDADTATAVEAASATEAELSLSLRETPEILIGPSDFPGPGETETVSEVSEEELPLATPPIRPPAEAGSSRFEFGLAQALPAAMPTYNLFEVEKAPAKTTAVIPPFWADEEVGYAPDLGSRLGFCLQTHDEYSLNLPPDAFFAPDALLLQHVKQHQPKPVPVPKSIDLIDQFLRSKPRFKAPLPLPPTTEAQADLSVRSTLAEPGLASESLARILARQGKIVKAIEIYERLMVRQPEKKAYFADQIQQLQTFE
ncbi:hypothetical protein SAMN00120144_3775 [Hymenobacter roseosalivarius DSM 11622]|uniref:Uncharacterized protein n=1 Tax=Hymenobacter roseosalivarius DSM 11622 TaxID=645990 RepID=A0A1W1W0R7_9BACT|nr:hypothetical protein [Hymenobacter roseosalivarius]SMB98951.1 hypothetical protein SAMN00120144_3775 [Hymenobacter roseosalivarius DSM 11622]